MHTEKILHAPDALLPDPAQDFSVFHQSLLAVAARHVKNIQRWRIGQSRIRRQPQSFQVAN